MSTALKPTTKTFTPKWSAQTPPVGPANPAAAPISLDVAITRPRTKRVMHKDELKSIQRHMHDVTSDRIYDWMLDRLVKHHQDLVDPDQLAAASKRTSFPETCLKCLGKFHASSSDTAAMADMWSEAPCEAVQGIIDSVISEERATHGAFLLQDPQVVFGQIELQLVFDSPLSTRRMKNMKTGAPAAFNMIKQFLCGPGYHMHPPKADNHEAWTNLLARLRFDWIRDNRTPIFTELSKHWKKRHTPFEQFAHFLFFRDSLPARPTVNMLTHAQKPVLVAAMAGDTPAFVLLARLGFAHPSDAAWERTQFLKQMLDTRRYAVLRHLNCYFFRRQFKNPAPVVLQSFRMATTSSPQSSPSHEPASHDPAVTAELARIADGYQQQQPLRIWEPRPPKKGGGGNSSKPQRSVMDDPSFQATLPDLSAAAPATAATSGGAWANMARKTSPPQNPAAHPPIRSANASLTSPPAPPAPAPTPVPATRLDSPAQHPAKATSPVHKPAKSDDATAAPVAKHTAKHSAPAAPKSGAVAAQSTSKKPAVSPAAKQRDPAAAPAALDLNAAPTTVKSAKAAWGPVSSDSAASAPPKKQSGEKPDVAPSSQPAQKGAAQAPLSTAPELPAAGGAEPSSPEKQARKTAWGPAPA
jgi:hypothetical protein